MLTSRDVSSLVIDNLCDQAGDQNATVACFYFDFAAQKEQSPTSTMGALLKQVVGGLEEVPEAILLAYHKQKKNTWRAGASAFRYYEDATNYLFQRAYVHMYRRSGRMCARTSN